MKHVKAASICLFIATLLLLTGIASAAPVAQFSGTPTSGTLPLTVNFADSSTGGPAGWAWFFGDEQYNQSWILMNGSSGWTKRGSHTSVVLPDGSIVLMGGYNGAASLNDTWRSTDNGATWTLLNGSSGWPARSQHTSVVLPDGSIVLMGGVTPFTTNDTWRSTNNGATWTLMNASSGWSPRYGLTSVALSDGSIVMMGGNKGPGYMNDVWRSADNGATWVQQTASAAWPARYGLSSVPMPDGSIVIMGGTGTAGTTSDVWRSTDSGATWSQLTAGSAWTGRLQHTSVVMPDGSIVLMGGLNGVNMRNVYRSLDIGATWTQVNASAGWSARYQHTSVAMPDGSIVLMGGNDGSYVNDTWRFQPAGSVVQNPSHSYPAAGTYSVALQAFNSGGYNSIRKTGYITARIPAPVASFSGTPRSGTASLAVSFSDISSDIRTGWDWFFGDELYNQPWTRQNASPGWQGRAGPTSVTMTDGSIVLMGGLGSGLGLNAAMNDTWKSTDAGVTWTLVNASSGWSKRGYLTSVAMPDGSIVLMGGYDNVNSYNDTWKSTDAGVSWSLMNASSGWAKRSGHTSVLIPDGSIVLMGGSGGGTSFNDSWRSTDNGVHWSLLNPNSGWTARTGHTSVVMPDGNIVLMGGDTGSDSNDTWKSTDNGAHWTLMNNSSGWSARELHTSIAMPDSSIVLMGGFDGGGVTTVNDTWRSTDEGATWTMVNASPGWPKRNGQTGVLIPDGSIILMGGYNLPTFYNDTWRFQPVGSSSQNPLHTYTAVGNYSVALQAYNSGGYNSTRSIGYITVSSAPTPVPQSDGGSSDGGPALATTPGQPGTVLVNAGQGGHTSIIRVNVTGVGVKGLIVTATEATGPGSGISPPPGNVYEYDTIVPARYTTITDSHIIFYVTQSWLDQFHLAPQDIVLYRNINTSWQALPTTLDRVEKGQAYYTATNSGFSLFAITGQAGTGSHLTTSVITGQTAGDTITPVTSAAPVTGRPVTAQTTAIPVPQPAPGSPLSIIVIIGAIILVLIGAGFLIRRWWVRRQNPALFRKYD